MNIPPLNNQEFSERTLKGFLLKNIDPNTKNPTFQQINYYLVNRVDEFWDKVVLKLQKDDNFDGNKINWYYEVYKEGIDAKKLSKNPFVVMNIDEEKIKELVLFFKDKTIVDYLSLGTSFLSNSYTLLSSWMRDKMVLKRLEHIYFSDDPYDWIIKAQEEENGIMDEKPDIIDGLLDVIKNISLIMSKRL